jgi:ATP/maltotriose-dependent transcriptional regulator MalT
VADTDEQRVHTLISLRAALQVECRWSEAVEVASRARALAEGRFALESARLAAHDLYAAITTGRCRFGVTGYERSKALVLENGSPSLRAAFLNGAATAHIFIGSWAVARELLAEAAELSRRYDYVFLEAIIGDGEAQVRSAVGDVEGAASVRSLAVSAQSIVDDAYCLSMALCHAGTEARRAGDTETAIGWYAQAVAAAEGSTAHYAYLNALANRDFCSSGRSYEARAALAGVARDARELDLLFVALKADFFAATLLYRDGERDEALDHLAECIPRQLDLGHLNFLVQELVLEPEMALDFIHARAEADVAVALIELIARHWNGMSLLIACLALDPVAGVAAATAGVAQRNDAEVGSILAKAAKSPFGEVRRTATALRRRRKAAPGETSGGEADLTPRERQILAMMADGAANADIARDLVLSPATVKTHVNHIFTKLGAKDRVQAVLRHRETMAAAPAQAPASTPKARETRQDTTVG